MRVKTSVASKKRHKKILKATKGYRGLRRHSVKKAIEALLKAGAYAYRDRRNKKREFRRLWNIRINAGCRLLNVKYSQFIGGLKKHKIELDRKILADLAATEPKIFEEIVKKAISNP